MDYKVRAGWNNCNPKKIELPNKIRKLYSSALLNVGESLSAYLQAILRITPQYAKVKFF